ncbi:MAG: NAD-dependent dehydratase [Candidatus Diapherotrites archaeon]|uniref:UDP-glucuronate decarboxylase n=1 Tax=Candidatus Iainarchaeum sp. TaxID=3101447 RepID=A0A2D6M059_9ARCH|nr:NAD-dependent dehydratase [Candidatus Diapherotrites archaeon]|tara:strand:+ start:5723 stop:6655 length:933 start_codon:yes stop_codon:yes gene_type:complete
MKTILVSGGAGFIGSHLTEKLLDEGNRVICMDNLVTGTEKNIQDFMDNKNYEFIKHDISQPIDLNEKVSEIYNLASPASPIDYQVIPIETLLAGSYGIKNLLDLTWKNKARILQSSTSEVYGDPLEHPQKESYWGNVNPIGLRSCYDESKRFAEAMMMAYHRVHDVDIRIVRIFNTFGPKMRPNDGRVIPTFVKQALGDKPITVFGEGDQTRSFCYVDDNVRGLMALMASNYTNPVNIGNPAEITILELAEKMVELCGSKSEIVHNPLPKDDPTRRKPDISLAKQQLGWEPKVDWVDGLKKTIDWFKENT